MLDASPPRLADLLHWRDLKDIDAAAALLMDALAADWRILIVGDFDADGATGVAVGVSGLKMLGARQVDYLVPDRVVYGYGLSPALAQLALQRQPQLLITVDNGISSLEGVAAMRAAGVRVIVTDHHLPGAALPAADAIVNPNQPGDTFASKNLAGVGVMFYLLAALRSRLAETGALPRDAPKLSSLLDLVALGTVADLVPLDANNRILVAAGLARMQAGRARPGIRALLAVAGREPRRIAASALGFALGPRINAAGRLEHMDRGIECLLAPDMARAQPLAEELDAINRQRREMQDDMQLAALEQLAGRLDASAAGLCVQADDWHEGIVGLIASRLKEEHHRPAVAFAPTADGQLKGSARSVPGFHLRDALALIDARHPGLIEKFGGHAMAAGLSLARDNFAPFAAAFESVCAAGLSEEMKTALWLSDGALAAGEISAANAQLLAAGGPWGQGFEEPQFDNEFEVVSQRIVGSGHLKLRLRAAGAEAVLDAIAFGVSQTLPPGPQRLVYQLDLNDYYDPPGLQLIVRGAGLAAD